MPIQGETRNCGQYNKDKNYAYPRRDQKLWSIIQGYVFYLTKERLETVVITTKKIILPIQDETRNCGQ